MMKKIMFVLLFIPLAYAFTAGDPIEFSIMNCKEWVVIDVNPINQIGNGTVEYWLDDCNKLENGLWMCYCKGETTKVVLRTDPKTVNTYGVTISYEYETPQKINTGSGGGGRSYIYIVTPNATVITEVIDNTQECDECKLDITDPTTSNARSTIDGDHYETLVQIEGTPKYPDKEKETVKQTTPNLKIGFWVVLLMIVIGLLAYGYYWYQKHSKK